MPPGINDGEGDVVESQTCRSELVEVEGLVVFEWKEVECLLEVVEVNVLVEVKEVEELVIRRMERLSNGPGMMEEEPLISSLMWSWWYWYRGQSFPSPRGSSQKLPSLSGTGIFCGKGLLLLIGWLPVLVLVGVSC